MEELSLAGFFSNSFCLKLDCYFWKVSAFWSESYRVPAQLELGSKSTLVRILHWTKKFYACKGRGDKRCDTVPLFFRKLPLFFRKLRFLSIQGPRFSNFETFMKKKLHFIKESFQFFDVSILFPGDISECYCS